MLYLLTGFLAFFAYCARRSCLKLKQQLKKLLQNQCPLKVHKLLLQLSRTNGAVVEICILGHGSNLIQENQSTKPTENDENEVRPGSNRPTRMRCHGWKPRCFGYGALWGCAKEQAKSKRQRSTQGGRADFFSYCIFWKGSTCLWFELVNLLGCGMAGLVYTNM